MHKERRFGEFHISRECIKDIIDDVEMRKAFNQFVILDARANYIDDSITYSAWHDDFRPLQFGCMLPIYRLIFTRNNDNSITMKIEG